MKPIRRLAAAIVAFAIVTALPVAVGVWSSNAPWDWRDMLQTWAAFAAILGVGLFAVWLLVYAATGWE